MALNVVLLSVPGLRQSDVARMPRLQEMTGAGEMTELVPSFPCVTCPVQANMTTGRSAREHGVVANGFYWREQGRIEMWTSPNDCIASPQIWEVLTGQKPERTSAVWFPLHSKECRADSVCTPAPIHNPDGSESLWCYTRPTELYGTLRDELGHFPLKHFWGPMAAVPSTAWIIDSAVCAAGESQPNFFYIYLPHLDYAAQRDGPDSDAAARALTELDEQIGRLVDGFREAYPIEPVWLVAGEYAIVPVDRVCYPNRRLREAGLLSIREGDDGEYLDPIGSRAWALTDHQFSHVFVNDDDRQTLDRVVELFSDQPGIDEVLVGESLSRYKLDHERSGQVVLVSTADSWQAYYYWFDEKRAPAMARTVDIHRKPGYDPVELCFDPATKSIPLDATRIAGSHGAPAVDASQRTVMLASASGLFSAESMADTDVFGVVMRALGAT